MAAARTLMLQHGLRAARVADVAARAGLAKGTVYLHFGDKDALVEEVLRAAIAAPLAAIRLDPMRQGESVASFLRRTIAPLLARVEAEGTADLIRLVVRESGDYPQLGPIYRSIVIAPMLQFFARLAAAARGRGEIATDALERFPMLLIAPAVLAMIWNGLPGEVEKIDPAEIFAAFLEVAFGTDRE